MPGLSVAILALLGVFIGMSGMFTSDICEDDDDNHGHDDDHHHHTHDDKSDILDVPDEPISM